MKHLDEGDFDISHVDKCIINVGSVGQPRDEDPRACFTTYDDEKNIITTHRVTYDIKATQDKIIAAGISPFLAKRLEEGH